MTKSAWESRVGSLLDPSAHSEFVYSYKPYDSALYGGQPRIDWLACDRVGRFWIIEVKKLPDGRKSFDPKKLCSPGQIQALDAVAGSGVGVPLLAIGVDDLLYFFDWRKIQWLVQSTPVPPQRWALETEYLLYFRWTGPKAWKTNNLYDLAQREWARRSAAASPLFTPMAGLTPQEISAGSLPPPPPLESPLISKRKDSIRTRRRKLLSALLYSM